MSEDEDWLALPKSGQELFLEALGDDVSPAIPDAKLPANVDPEYAAVIRAYRQLSPKQRIYCRCLVQNYGRHSRAQRAMRDEHFISINPSTYSRWHRDPRFVRAVELTKKQCLAYAEVDPTSLMLRTAEVIDQAMEPEEIFDKEGRIVGHKVDRQSALRGIEWLGKVHKMGGDDGSNRTTLNLIVNLATRDDTPVLPPIEGEILESNG
jgi:hypothetical protein